MKMQKQLNQINQNSLSQKQNKYLSHFQIINNIDPTLNIYNQQQSNRNSQKKQAIYLSRLQSYAQNKISQIQRIIKMNDDQNTLRNIKKDFKITNVTTALHVKNDIKQNINKINNFFDIEQKNKKIDQQVQEQLLNTDILQIGVFSQILKCVKQKITYKQQIKDQISIYNTPQQKSPFNINIAKQSIPNTQTQRIKIDNLSQIKLRKADMILVQILRQKKRKGLVSDYFKIMELKLFQLLDYILQDQPEYQGLISIDKMKQVLKKLDSFKGKKIQGQNKINLLKIFFQEFRNLKNQMTENQKNVSIHKGQYKHKQKQKQVQNDIVTVSKRQQKTTNRPHNRNVMKRPILKQTIGEDRQQKTNTNNSRLIKSVKGLQDQWLGQLEYQ